MDRNLVVKLVIGCWQKVAVRPEQHEQVLAAMMGYFEFDNAESTCDRQFRYRQMRDDLAELGKCEGIAEMMYGINDPRKMMRVPQR